MEVKEIRKSRKDLRKTQSSTKSNNNRRELVTDRPGKFEPKVHPGHSKWFQGTDRLNWKRPCFAGFDTVVLGDSQLKIYGKQNKRKPGFSITSYSGCDVSIGAF